MKKNIQNNILFLRLLFCFLGATIVGCTPTQKNLSPDFGQSLSQAFTTQAINPAAPVDATPVDSLSGDLGEQIYQKRYVKMMTEEKEEKEDASSQLKGLQ